MFTVLHNNDFSSYSQGYFMQSTHMYLSNIACDVIDIAYFYGMKKMHQHKDMRYDMRYAFMTIF